METGKCDSTSDKLDSVCPELEQLRVNINRIRELIGVMPYENQLSFLDYLKQANEKLEKERNELR